MYRSFSMPKFATTIFLATISINSFAQKSVLSIEKLGLKSLQAQVSYIPAKSFNSLTSSDCFFILTRNALRSNTAPASRNSHNRLADYF